MIISDRGKFIFFHVPKCAGTTVRTVLSDYDDRDNDYWFRERARDPSSNKFVEFDKAHMTLQLFSDFYPQDFSLISTYTTFAFTRHPWDRLVSAFFEPRQHLTRPLSSSQLDPNHCGQIYADFQKYVRMIINGPDFLSNSFVHATPQHLYHSYNRKRLVDVLISLESPDHGLKILKSLSEVAYNAIESKIKTTRFNSKSKQIHKLQLIETLPKTTRKKLYDMYSDDFELLGYEDNAR